MVRPLAPLDELTARAALDYIERALERRSEVFSVPLLDAREAFSELHAARARTQEWLDSANDWFIVFMTPDGRAKMLAALRRRRAGGSRTSTTMRLPCATHAELVSLAGKLNVPASVALAGMLHLLRQDKDLQRAVEDFAANHSSAR